MVPGKPIFVMSWIGLEPQLPSILLNSHTDVVPVFPESWKYDAFEAVKEENGETFGCEEDGLSVAKELSFFTQGTFMVEELKT